MKKFELKFDDWRDARWVINCAMGAIENTYEKNSPRWNEMNQLHKELHEQMEKQVGQENYNT